jgi:hypothetical protein
MAGGTARRYDAGKETAMSERAEQQRQALENPGHRGEEDGIAEGEYPVWSPYEAHEAAAALVELLGREEERPARQTWQGVPK